MLLLIGGIILKSPPEEIMENRVIRYVAIGDSYTIGNGVLEQERWPNVLVGHLVENGINVELVANPAVSGFTVLDAINYEVSVLKKYRSDLITVLIGANDNFRGKPVEDFKTDLRKLLDLIEQNASVDASVILVSIPDYTASPAAAGYSSSERAQIRQLIDQYNKVIQEEAEKRDLGFADISPISQTMTSEDFYIEDGLHPSGKGYALWEKEIFPEVMDQLQR